MPKRSEPRWREEEVTAVYYLEPLSNGHVSDIAKGSGVSSIRVRRDPNGVLREVAVRYSDGRVKLVLPSNIKDITP